MASPGLLRFRPGSIAVVMVAAVALSGCSGATTVGTTEGTRAAIPSSRPTAPPVALGSRVLIDGTGLSFASDDGEIVDSVAYTDDPVEARDRLTEWLASTPSTTSTISDHYCAPTSDPIVSDDWGTGLVLTHLSPGGDVGYQFSVSATVASVGEFEVGTPQGFTVGDSAGDFIAAIPGVDADLEAGVTRVYYDQPDEGWTAYAWGWEGGAIEEIRAPYGLVETC